MYPTDIHVLKRVEQRLVKEDHFVPGHGYGYSFPPVPGDGHVGARLFAHSARRRSSASSHATGTVSASAPTSVHTLSASYEEQHARSGSGGGRPRASTSPLLPSLAADHQVWFDDPRFDGSFPSRVLPFLYLGNLCVYLDFSSVSMLIVAGI